MRTDKDDVWLGNARARVCLVAEVFGGGQRPADRRLIWIIVASDGRSIPAAPGFERRAVVLQQARILRCNVVDQLGGVEAECLSGVTVGLGVLDGAVAIARESAHVGAQKSDRRLPQPVADVRPGLLAPRMLVQTRLADRAADK